MPKPGFKWPESPEEQQLKAKAKEMTMAGPSDDQGGLKKPPEHAGPPGGPPGQAPGGPPGQGPGGEGPPGQQPGGPPGQQPKPPVEPVEPPPYPSQLPVFPPEVTPHARTGKEAEAVPGEKYVGEEVPAGSNDPGKPAPSESQNEDVAQAAKPDSGSPTGRSPFAPETPEQRAERERLERERGVR